MKNAMMKVALSLACAILLATAAGVQGDTIQAFSGNTCDGAAGNVVQCDGSCHLFQGRHSFRVSGGGNHCVTMFVDTGCPNPDRFVPNSRFTFQNQNGGCQNVNTGTNIQSFLCSPSNLCMV